MTTSSGAAGDHTWNVAASFGGGTAEDRIRRVEQQVAQVRQRAAKAQVFKEQMAELRVVGTSREGGAEVEVDSAGVVTDLVLTDRLDRATLAEIRSEILEAIDDARRRAGERAEEYVTDAFGNATGLAELFRPRFTSDEDEGEDTDPRGPRRRGGVIG